MRQPITESPIELDEPGNPPAPNGRREADEPPRTPRWVKLFGIVVAVLLLAFAGLHVTGNVPMHAFGMQHSMEAP